MGFSKAKKINIVVTVILLLLCLFANIYTVRQGARYGIELYLYDKLLVAYRAGGMSSLENEIERAINQDRMPREAALAKAFKNELSRLEAPVKFLEDTVEKRKAQIRQLRIWRNIAFGFILVIILLRFLKKS